MRSLSAEREARLARNEALFREVNERIADLAHGFGRDEAYEFLCECADLTCTERVALTAAEYEHVRSDGTTFVLAPGHANPEIEKVVARQDDDHVVVEKVGVAGAVAAELDPRD